MSFLFTSQTFQRKNIMATEKKNLKYEDALKELEQIVSRMESGDCDIDQLTSQLKRAQQLITYCRERLSKTETEVKKLLTN